MISRFLTLVALFIFSSGAFASTEVAIPEKTARVMFTGKVQPTAAQKEKLNATIKDLQDVNKIQMAVLVVDSIKPLAIEEYSLKVAESWKLGQKDVDNGVLLVVATSDRKARIEVGKGLEGVLTDAMTKRIQSDKMIPHFKKGDFAEGIVAAVSGIKVATTKEVPVIAQALKVKKAEANEKASDAFLYFAGFFGIAIATFGFLFWRSKKNRQKLEAEQEIRREKARQEYVNALRSAPAYNAPRRTPTPSSPIRSAPSPSPSSSSSSKSRSSDSDAGYVAAASTYSSRSSSDDDSYSRSSSSSSSSSISDSDSGGGGSFSGGGSSSDW